MFLRTLLHLSTNEFFIVIHIISFNHFEYDYAEKTSSDIRRLHNYQETNIESNLLT